MKNKAKYRNTGLDIRSNGGYIIISPSSIGNKKYELDENRTEFLEMPTSLINFLLIGSVDIEPSKTLSKNMNNVIKQKIKGNVLNYDIDDIKLKNLLWQLDDKYLNNFNDWLIITTIMKNLNLKNTIF